MIRQCTKLIALMLLIFGVGLANGDVLAAESDGELPLRSVTIVLANGTQEQFFDQLRKFSDTYAFAIRIAPTRPDVPSFLVQMFREDIKLIGTNTLNSSEFRISFYQNDDHPVESASLNQMVVGLKQAVEQVQGATVSEVK